MKKVSIVFLSLLIIVLMTGCGIAKDKEKTLVCTTTESEDGINVDEVISMTYKNDKLSYMKIEVNTKVTDTDVQSNWDAFKKSMDEQNKEFDKDGISLKVEKNDKNYEYKIILGVDVQNATEEALEEQGFDGLKDDDSTLEETKKEAEEAGAVCEVK